MDWGADVCASDLDSAALTAGRQKLPRRRPLLVAEGPGTGAPRLGTGLASLPPDGVSRGRAARSCQCFTRMGFTRMGFTRLAPTALPPRCWARSAARAPTQVSTSPTCWRSEERRVGHEGLRECESRVLT